MNPVPGLRYILRNGEGQYLAERSAEQANGVMLGRADFEAIEKGWRDRNALAAEMREARDALLVLLQFGDCTPDGGALARIQQRLTICLSRCGIGVANHARKGEEPMTAEEFAVQYAGNSGHDLAWFRRHCQVWTCGCGHRSCHGFQAIPVGVDAEWLANERRKGNEPALTEREASPFDDLTVRGGTGFWGAERTIAPCVRVSYDFEGDGWNLTLTPEEARLLASMLQREAGEAEQRYLEAKEREGSR